MSSVASTDVRPRLWRSRWAAIGAAVAVTFGGGGLFAVSAASPESSTVAIDPVRILDTRTDVGLLGPFVSPVPQDLKVTGSIPTATGTKTVVPAGATGVFLNLTPVSSTAAGFISVRPANAAGLPTTSNVNFTVGAINPNAVLVELPVGGGDDGKIEITFDAFGTAGPTTEVLVDVVGYTTDTRIKTIETKVGTIETKVASLETKVASLAPPLFATIDGFTGTVFDGISFGLTSVTRVSVGEYELTFNRSVANCASATSDWNFATTKDISADVRFAASDNTVTVHATDAASANVDTFFSIIVQCPPAGAPLTAEDLGAPNPNE